MSQASMLDSVYRSLLLTKFFTKGWGKPEHLERVFALRRKLGDRDAANKLVSPVHPVVIDRETVKPTFRLLEGHFITPAKEHLNGDDLLLPKECQTAHFELVLPVKEKENTPVCVQFAGTGDHYFWRRRRLMALPMLEERGIASLIVENPFYGLRKPKEQLRSSLRNVSDLFVMGACLVMESLVLFHWCQREGYGPIIFHGISMGGHMATLSATVIPKPIGVVPCLSWSSASLTFTKGVLTGAIPWSVLEQQLQLHRKEITAALGDGGKFLRGTVESWPDSAFRAGVEFAQNRLAVPGGELQQQEPGGDKSGLFLSSLGKAVSSLHIPFISSPVAGNGNGSGPSADLKEDLRIEALHFMRGIMDECTHLSNYSVPLDPTLCIAVAAERDAYQPMGEGVMAIPDIWLGSQMRVIFGHGHVTSYLVKQNVFRQAVYDSLDALVAKYHTK